MNGIYGIDYGAKMAGTTVVAFVEGGVLRFAASAKKQDADRFLLDFFAGHAPGKIFIDAPLSLPEVYSLGSAHLPEGEVPDYHYRACDRALGAMSPMFLGGLTARAMKLAFILRKRGWEVHETYPGALARLLGLDGQGYKSDAEAIALCFKALQQHEPGLGHIEGIGTWHHFDALLAWCSAMRWQEGRARLDGTAATGCIVY
jgi:uncharacterized protein